MLSISTCAILESDGAREPVAGSGGREDEGCRYDSYFAYKCWSKPAVEHPWVARVTISVTAIRRLRRI